MTGGGWEIFQGTGQAPPGVPVTIPDPPAWRRFDIARRPEEVPAPPDEPVDETLAALCRPEDDETVLMVNAALRLRRPLLITGPPGSGKSTLARLIARELRLGQVLRWPITSSSRLIDGLYHYDAIAWVQSQNEHRPASPAAIVTAGTEPGPDEEVVRQRRIGGFIRLGPLGTALLPWARPRLLLVDEIDKADIDLPNDLLHVMEEGSFEIRELIRLDDKARETVDVLTADRRRKHNGDAEQARRTVHEGIVRCTQFPLILMTSNGERAFPPAFLRRCLQLRLDAPVGKRLETIVTSRVAAATPQTTGLIQRLAEAVGTDRTVAVDQVLNAVFILTSAGERWSEADRQEKAQIFLKGLD